MKPRIWISKSLAANILDAPEGAVDELAAQGRLRVRDLPTRNKYNRAEVEALAESCVRPALMK